MGFQHVKVGDVVTRNMAGVIMKALVTEVDAERIWCGQWSFDRVTGAEIDDDLRWGPPYAVNGECVTGSYLEE